MTQIQHTYSDRPLRPSRGHVAGRAIAFLYGLAAYLVFFVTILYAI
jgi:hypothetical protein